MIFTFFRVRMGISATSIRSAFGRGYLWDAAVFLWFLALTLYLTQQREFPYLFDDEYGVLGAAAVLAGHDWTTPAGMPFYGFGLSLLIAPLYHLSLEPSTLYRAALSVNGLLVALSAVLALRTVRLVSPLSPRLFQVGAVIAAFSYPAVLFYAGMAMGETLLLFCFALIAYGLVALVGQRDPKYLTPILLGLGLGLAPYAHTRGLVFWLAVVPVCLFAWRAKWVAPKSIGIALLSGMLVAGALAIVKSWLTANFYSQVRSGTGSAGDFVINRLSLFEQDQVLVVARVAWGQLAYLASSSFGLVLVGLVAIMAALRPIRQVIGNRVVAMDDGDKRQVIAAALVGLAFVLMFAVSVVQMGRPVRADHFFYGRYNEVILPPVLIAGLLFLTTFNGTVWRVRLAWLATGLGAAALLMLGVGQFPAEIFERTMIWNPLTSWFVHIQGAWKIQPEMIATGTLVGGIVLALALAISRRVFILALAAMFTSAALHNYAIQHRGADRAWSGFGTVGATYGALLLGRQIQVVGDRRMQLSGEALQFALPHSRVNFAGQVAERADVFLDSTGKHCTDKNTVTRVTRVGNATICVLDEDLQAAMMKSSVLMKPPTRARSQPPARIDLDSAKVITTGVMSRACALATQFYYSRWGRYCLPTVDVSIARQNLDGTESQKLGFFITNAAGEWLGEWRADMDTAALARGETIHLHVPVQFGDTMCAGNYILNAAVVDDDGWDWRSKISAKLVIK